MGTVTRRRVELERHVALIRGINVGRAKRVAMADLRRMVEALGYRDVVTLLNSGNVVFTPPARAAASAGARIERAMADRLGVSARVTVLSASEVAAAVAENPLLPIAPDHARLLVMVLRTPGDRTKLTALAGQDWKPDVLAVGRRVAYLWCADGILTSRLLAALVKALGDGGTSRNWATMIKLHALAGCE